MTPNEVKSGQIISVLYDKRFPYILRPKGIGPQSFVSGEVISLPPNGLATYANHSGTWFFEQLTVREPTSQEVEWLEASIKLDKLASMPPPIIVNNNYVLI